MATATKQDPLRPDERKLINYHRANLAKGGMKDGNSITTFRGGRYGVGKSPDGEHIYAPTYFNNKINNDEDTLAHAKKTGLFAMYPTAKAANDAEYKLHEIMSRDTRKYMDAKRPRMSNLMGMKK